MKPYETLTFTDSFLFGKGEPYRNLPENNVLFICTFDPFGLGLPIYTFKVKCIESDSLYLEDGVVTYFFNTTYRTKESRDLSDSIKNMYTYIQTGQATDDLTGQLSAAVDKGKRDAIWRSDYMIQSAAIMDYIEEGREEGREEACNMLLNAIKSIKAGKSDEELRESGIPDNYIALAKSALN